MEKVPFKLASLLNLEDQPHIFINIYKPKGITSRQVVNFLQKKLGRKHKIGHLGTLDPFAEGVLPIGINKALKFQNLLHTLYPKTYLAHGVFGHRTDTGDDTGVGYCSMEKLNLSSEDLRAELKDRLRMEKKLSNVFIGPYLQTPPLFSATKFKGKPLYYWKRVKGMEIKKPPVARTIFELKILKSDLKGMSFECKVSSGTYVRTLFEDMGRKLNLDGHLRGLVRKQIGPFHSEKALCFEKLQKFCEGPRDEGPQFLKEYTWSLTDIFPFKKMHVDSDFLKAYDYGQNLNLGRILGRNFSFGSLSDDFIEKHPTADQYFWFCKDKKGVFGLGLETEHFFYSLCKI